jgi:ABC-type multidrug transport system fused ATPase/permease subunit
MLINTAFSAGLFFLTGLKLAPYEMLIGVFLLAIFLFPLKYLSKNIDGFGKGLILEWEKLSESLLRGLKNNFLLSIYNQVDPEIKKGDESLKKYKTHYMNYTFVAGFVSAFPLLIGVVILSLITFLSVKYIKTDPVKLVSFFYVFIRLAQAASEANGTLSSLKLNMPGLKKLFEWSVRSDLLSQKKVNQIVSIDTKNVDIEVSGLAFNFEDQKPLFQNLNFKIAKSEMLLIKGKSGAGKSTLLSLILGLRLPTKGEVKIANHSSESYSFDFHKVLAYVGPEPYLVEGTVRENLVYGLDENIKVDDNDLWESLKIMELDDLIAALPMKLAAKVAEIPQMSTGQRQRLSFARALVRKPALLILDEATANLDAATEEKIIHNLKDFFKNCTCIVVTHKNSFDAFATYGLTLAEGSDSTR